MRTPPAQDSDPQLRKALEALKAKLETAGEKPASA
jgi:hypothetical protein